MEQLQTRFATGTQTELQVVGGQANVPQVLNQVYRLDKFAKNFPEMLTSAFVPSAEAAILARGRRARGCSGPSPDSLPC